MDVKGLKTGSKNISQKAGFYNSSTETVRAKAIGKD